MEYSNEQQLSTCTHMTVISELFSIEGRRLARAALVARYPYLVHSSSCANLESIRVRGLLPRFIEFAADADPVVVMKAFGGVRPAMVCLTTPHSPVHGSHEGASVVFAISTTDLPEAVCLDWSYSGTWRLPDTLTLENCVSTEEAFLETFRRRGSVVVCDPIPPSKLRVRLATSIARDPSGWPSLLAADLTDVYQGAP